MKIPGRQFRPCPWLCICLCLEKSPLKISVIKIAYDDDYLYVSGVFDYKNPDDLRAFSKKRDYTVAKCDWFGVLIDTFNDRQNSVMFWTNPNGLRTEGTLQNDMVDQNLI